MPVASRPSPLAPRGFSLLELLVVIAVMAVLVSIVAPQFGRAKDHAKLALCRTRLHNIGVGLHAYAGENNAALPVEPALDNPHAGLLAALARYVDNRENFYCPSDRDEPTQFAPANVEAGRIGYFYYSCSAATGNADVSTFLRWEVGYPRELKTTLDGGTWVMSDAWYSGRPTAHGEFKKGVNYLLLSGAAGMVTQSPRTGFR